MKELTIEQKAQSYDEAIERAKQVCKTPYTAHWDVMKELIEHLFPELKEDEDDKIRKEIVSAINIYCSEYLSGTKIRNDMLAWLEKQGEPKDYKVI